MRLAGTSMIATVYTMSDAIVSVVLSLIGVSVGWLLNEASLSWRRRAEQRERERAEADARVFEAADAATSVAEGLRWLVQIDIDRAASGGEGISTPEYERAALAAGSELRRLRLALLPIAAKGPRASLARAETIVREAQQLWDSFAATSRKDMGRARSDFLVAAMILPRLRARWPRPGRNAAHKEGVCNQEEDGEPVDTNRQKKIERARSADCARFCLAIFPREATPETWAEILTRREAVPAAWR
jgi:hypothetical protein